jgi:hypothetical protein
MKSSFMFHGHIDVTGIGILQVPGRAYGIYAGVGFLGGRLPKWAWAPKLDFDKAPKSIPTRHAIFYVHGHQVAFIETYFWQFSVSFLHRCCYFWRALFAPVTPNFLEILKFLRVRIRREVCALLGVEYSVRAKKIAENSIRMVRHSIRAIRKVDSNGSNKSKTGTLFTHIFILFTSDIACQVRNSVTEMSKGPTGGIIFGHFRHAIRPFL